MNVKADYSPSKDLTLITTQFPNLNRTTGLKMALVGIPKHEEQS